MKEKSGIDLLPFIDNSAKVLLVSGRPTYELHNAVQKHEKIDDYLPKMFKGEELILKARALLDVW